jgi:hypothetical protein
MGNLGKMGKFWRYTPTYRFQREVVHMSDLPNDQLTPVPANTNGLSFDRTQPPLADVRPVTSLRASDLSLDEPRALLDRVRAESPSHDPDRAERQRRLRGLCDLGALPRAVQAALLDGAEDGHSARLVELVLGRVVLVLRRQGVPTGGVTQMIRASALAGQIEAFGADVEPTVAEAIGSADNDLERARRPGENFTVRQVERVEHADAPGFVLTVVRDDRPGEPIRVELRWGDLESYWRFQSRLVREIGFMPLLKPQYRGERFGVFAAKVVNDTHPPACKAEHGTRHGRAERGPHTDDLVVAALRAYVMDQGGFWEGRVTPLYAIVCERVMLYHKEFPLDWPRTPTALAWTCRRVGRDGFEAAGLEWRRYQQHGRNRVPLYTFRLRREANSSTAA